MGYLFDPDRNMYIHESFCDENGYYDADALNEMSSDYMYAKSTKASSSADSHDKKRKIARDKAKVSKDFDQKKRAAAYDAEGDKESAMTAKRTRQASKFATYGKYKQAIEDIDRKAKNESGFLCDVVFK